MLPLAVKRLQPVNDQRCEGHFSEIKLSHVRCGHEAAIAGFTHRGVLEVEAESVAYLVCRELALNTDAYSFGYLVSWSGGDAEVVRKTADKVIKTARTILEELESGASREAVAA